MGAVSYSSIVLKGIKGVAEVYKFEGIALGVPLSWWNWCG
jgi:hypothetical protein